MGNESTKKEKLSQSTGSPVNTCKSCTSFLELQIIHLKGVKCALHSTGSTKEVWSWRVDYIHLKRSQQICNSSKWIFLYHYMSLFIDGFPGYNFQLEFPLFSTKFDTLILWAGTAKACINGSDSVEPKNRNIAKQLAPYLLLNVSLLFQVG